MWRKVTTDYKGTEYVGEYFEENGIVTVAWNGKQKSDSIGSLQAQHLAGLLLFQLVQTAAKRGELDDSPDSMAT